MASTGTGLITMLSLFRRWHIHRILSQPLGCDRKQWLKDHVVAYHKMAPALQLRLEQIVAVMLARCHWEGCEDLVLRDEMRTRIAGHAAVMLLGAQDYYFDSVSAILVFPGIIRRSDSSGRSLTVGEAWQNGGVVLSWPEVQRIGTDLTKHNVVVHEFAHHLDGRDGEMGGSIPFSSNADQARWTHVATLEYARLVEDVRHHRGTVFDPYGATNEAEFFAVASEAFFEQPNRMEKHHQDLFELMMKFYQIDPRLWGEC
jgi:Mlc titration factor MtfA (ptsG expression regulator)